MVTKLSSGSGIGTSISADSGGGGTNGDTDKLSVGLMAYRKIKGHWLSQTQVMYFCILFMPSLYYKHQTVVQNPVPVRTFNAVWLLLPIKIYPKP